MAGEDGAETPLYGRHPVLELLRAGSRRVEEIAILGEGRGPALQELLTLARRRGVRISYRTRDQLTAMAGTPHHQGVVARVAQPPTGPWTSCWRSQRREVRRPSSSHSTGSRTR